jgi:hypothetical protein
LLFVVTLRRDCVTMLLLALGIERPFLRNGAVMLVIFRKFYAVRVDDLKPISGQDFAESFEADELVYFIDAKRENVVMSSSPMCVSARDHSVTRPPNTTVTPGNGKALRDELTICDDE